MACAGLVYQQYYDDPQVLEVATVTKLVRKPGMLLIIPLMTDVYHRNSAEVCLAIVMTAVGLGTSIQGLKSTGLKPVAVGLFSALLADGVSASFITLMY